MARANRHCIPGCIWHITHCCHKKEFLLKFAHDRHRFVSWLLEARKRFSLQPESQTLSVAASLTCKNLLTLAVFAIPLILGLLLARPVLGGEPFYPNDPYFFYNPELPEFPGQWHLVNTAPLEGIDFQPGNGYTYHLVNSGVDANLAGAWSRGYTGAGVIIGIADEGVQGNHPDLIANYRPDLSKNFSQDPAIANLPQGPLLISDNHGTSVAGVAAARGGNGLGGTGAAPMAQIAGLNIFTSDEGAIPPGAITEMLYWQSGVDPTTGEIVGDALIRVKNHSYGLIKPYVPQQNSVAALARTAENGVISVYAGGNDRGTILQNTCLLMVQNSHYAMMVAGIGSDGIVASYSSFGANMFVTAPSGNIGQGFGITTTDRAGSELGYNHYSDANPEGNWYELFPDPDYTTTINGTSFSAPLVSGIMALGVEANPTMDVRMAKHVLTATSRQLDAGNATWGTNGAGLTFSPDYGFGLIDAGAFVDTVHRVGYVTSQSIYETGPTPVTADAGVGPGYIPDNDPKGLTERFTLSAVELAQPIEAVSVNLDVSTQSIFDINATLTSPSGMQSVLAYGMSSLPADQQRILSSNSSWDYLSNAFWGEDGIGTWTLTLADAMPGHTTIWNSYSVRFYLGEMRLLDPGETILDHDVSARSLSLLNVGADLVIPDFRSFSVEHDVLVDGGRLIVNGTLGESGSLGARVTLTGGELGGSGTVTASRGVTNSAGTIAPGNGVGILNIDGDYTQGAAGRLTIDIAGTADYDRLVVTGSASLDGMLQTYIIDGYHPTHGDRFTVLEASEVAGTFSQVSNLTPTLVLNPVYHATDVDLIATRDYENPSLVRYLDANQRAVAKALNLGAGSASGDFDTVLEQIDTLTSYGQAARAFDALSVKGNDAQLKTAFSTANVQASNLALRLHSVRAGWEGPDRSDRSGAFGPNPFDGVLLASTDSDLTHLGIYNAPRENDLGVFITGKVLSGQQDASAQQTGYDFTTTVVTLGIDRSFADKLVLGIFGSLHRSNVDINDEGTESKVIGGTLGLYGTRQWGQLFLDGAVSYGISRQDNSRRIAFSGVDRKAQSDVDGSLFSLYAGLGRGFDVWGWNLTPYAAAQYVRVVIDRYTETGAGSLNLTVDRQQYDILQPGLGARIFKSYTTGFGKLTPLVAASVQHRVGDDESNVSARLSDGQTPEFKVLTDGQDGTFGTAEVGIAIRLKNNTSLRLAYNTVVGESGYQEHGGSIGLNIDL